MIITACLAGAASAADVDTSWYTGHESDIIFTLNDAEDLFGFAQLVNNGNSFTGKTVTLGGNIDLNNEEWTPIGAQSHSFAGTFDGAGYTVSGLTIAESKTENYYGLFGHTSGYVNNLNVAGSISPSNIDATSWIGGLIGANYGTVTNCSSAVSVTVSGSNLIYVGGLIGYDWGGVSECSATGAVTTISSAASADYPSHTGGLIGYVYSGTISKNYATGTVSAENTASADVYAGGIVGYLAGGSITECYATCQVTAESTYGNAHAGGIAGYNPSSTISKCYATNEIRAQTASSQAFSGGIAGKSAGTVSVCYATGQVTANSTADVNKREYAGGIVGYNELTISDCYAINYGIAGNVKNGTAGGISNNAVHTDNFVWNRLLPQPDGTPVASTTVWNNFFGKFSEANVWQLNTDAKFLLPVLKNLPAPANADASHLFVPSVAFNANGGEGTMQTQFLDEGETSIILQPNTFTKVGHSFAGWAKTENGNVVYADNATIDNVNADITLYAKWNINTYTLRFEDYDCSTTIYYNEPFVYGADISGVSVADPTKDGYTFTGWWISYERPTTMPAWDVTIYAKWEVTKYNVSFEENGGTAVSDQRVNYTDSVAYPTEPTRHGYTFAGWYKDSALTTPWVFYDENKDVVTADTTLYAKWTGWTHTVRFHRYVDGAVQGNEQVQTLTYGSNTNLMENPFDLPQDKYFGGWATVEGGSDIVYEDKEDASALFTENNKETDLYTVWLDAVITYWNVTFMDGTEEYRKVQVRDGGVADNPEEPTKAGYDFEGWFKDQALTSAYDSLTRVSEDTVLYAKWIPNIYYVQFNNNTGTGTMVNQDFKYGVTEALSANTFTAPSGKEFAGWNTKADGSGDSYAAGYDKSDITVKNEDTVILYAQWKDIGGGNDGSDSGSDSDSDYDDYEPSTPSTPSKPSTPTTPDVPDTPDTPKVTDETKEISVSEENIVTLPTGDKVVVVALENTEAVQRVAVPEAVAQANPGASVKVTEGETAPALPESVAADNVHIVVGVSVVDKEGNPVKITESGYFILDADVPAGKKLVVGHYKNDIWVDCLVENLGNGQHKVHYNGLSPFAAVIIEEHEESPFTTEEKPTEEPAETPAPILGMVLGGLAAAVVLRRK